MIATIAGVASRQAAFHFQFTQRLVKSQEDVRGRCVAKFAVFLEAAKLAQEIKTQTSRATLGSKQDRSAANDKRETGRAFDAFVGRRNEKINAASFEIDWQRAKAAHGVHDKNFPFLSDNWSDDINWVQNPRSGFAMDHRHMSDSVIGIQAG